MTVIPKVDLKMNAYQTWMKCTKNISKNLLVFANTMLQV